MFWGIGIYKIYMETTKAQDTAQVTTAITQVQKTGIENANVDIPVWNYLFFVCLFSIS